MSFLDVPVSFFRLTFEKTIHCLVAQFKQLAHILNGVLSTECENIFLETPRVTALKGNPFQPFRE
jgi:hypothetical protein